MKCETLDHLVATAPYASFRGQRTILERKISMKSILQPLSAFLPAAIMCAILVATMSTYTSSTHVHAQQDVHTTAHAARPNAVSATVTQDGVNLYTCIPGSSNCTGSIISQFNEGDKIQVQCQLHVSGDPTGGWWSEVNSDYGIGWLSNAYISLGPGQISGVPACSTQK